MKKVISLILTSIFMASCVACSTNKIDNTKEANTLYIDLLDAGYGTAFCYELERIFEEEHPGLAEAIRQKYPVLSDTEYKVGIMALTPFSSQETADILGKSINTINKARTSIRKKLNIEEKDSIEEKLKTEN